MKKVISLWLLICLNCRPAVEPDISSPRLPSCAPRRESWQTNCSTTSSSPAPASGSRTPTWRPPARKTKWRSLSIVRRFTLSETSPTSWRAVTTSRSMRGASLARRNAALAPSSGSSHTDVLVSHNPRQSYINSSRVKQGEMETMQFCYLCLHYIIYYQSCPFIQIYSYYSCHLHHYTFFLCNKIARNDLKLSLIVTNK